jgi:nucleotide-binding universal stress UspA family protein
MKIILAALDFSAVGTAVIEQAARLAEGFGAKLWLVHVAAPDPDFVGYDAGPPNVRDQVAHELRDAHRRVQDAANGLRARGLDAAALQVQGPTADTIVSEAERLGADVIILGSHGHGALHRALLGSVSEGVLRSAACPVLIVPAPRATE